MPKKQVKKAVKKTTAGKKTEHSKKDLQKHFKLAEQIYEGKQDGVVLIYSVDKEPDGVEIKGLCRVFGVPESIRATIAMEALNLDFSSLMAGSLMNELRHHKHSHD